MENKEALKPCPICGGEAEIRLFYRGKRAETLKYVYCTNCALQLHGIVGRDTIEIWNTRA